MSKLKSVLSEVSARIGALARELETPAASPRTQVKPVKRGNGVRRSRRQHGSFHPDRGTFEEHWLRVLITRLVNALNRHVYRTGTSAAWTMVYDIAIARLGLPDQRAEYTARGVSYITWFIEHKQLENLVGVLLSLLAEDDDVNVFGGVHARKHTND